MNDNELGESGEMGEGEEAFQQITHGTKRAFLAAYAVTGRKNKACEAVGIDMSLLYSSFWKHDVEFQDACTEAYQMSADRMVDAATERAVDGTTSYKFHKGIPMRHPDRCECGHDRVAWHVKGGGSSPCAEPDCACSDFSGEFYREQNFSDNLLKFLLTGAMPERYGHKVELRGALANLDMAKLPPGLVARIAAGEHPLQVLAAAADAPAALLGMGELGDEEDPEEAHAEDDVSL